MSTSTTAVPTIRNFLLSVMNLQRRFRKNVAQGRPLPDFYLGSTRVPTVNSFSNSTSSNFLFLKEMKPYGERVIERALALTLATSQGRHPLGRVEVRSVAGRGRCWKGGWVVGVLSETILCRPLAQTLRAIPARTERLRRRMRRFRERNRAQFPSPEAQTAPRRNRIP